ncbi:c-type cytochrome [Magnetospira sp. QH-2]|uniref:c-type cytochrome n=1 Tax=Magnetospira sp. (strain QH-2) TaxID=1288970 RepID=UPI0003E815E8|nr:c-type cytochrome [Magnetospira sp. QH-2]CCQ75152.1 putative cytochrome c family protein [Magnetospira sp. QH-2]
MGGFKWAYVLVALVLTGLAGVYANIMVAGAPGVPGSPDDPDQVALGKVVYAETCAACHGDNLQGETPDWKVRKEDGSLPAPPHDTSGHTWHHDDFLLFDYVKLGGQALMPEGVISAMPGFADQLTDDQIWAVLAFIKSHWTLEARQRQAEMTKRAKKG